MIRVAIGKRAVVRETSRPSSHQPAATVYQDAFRTPGIIPDSASSRKQIRHTPNLLRYARDRPQRLQRLCACTLNFGFRFDFSIQDFFAMRWVPEKCAFVRLPR